MQVPPFRKVAVEPETEQTDCVLEVYVTGSPELAVPVRPSVVCACTLDGRVKVIVCDVWLTVRVKDCDAFGEAPFEAVMTMLYEPLVPAAGVPLRVAVPFWLSTKVMPPGRAPASASAGVG